MEVVYLLLFVSLVMAFGGLISFIWAVRSGQMDDLASEGEKFIIEDET